MTDSFFFPRLSVWYNVGTYLDMSLRLHFSESTRIPFTRGCVVPPQPPRKCQPPCLNSIMYDVSSAALSHFRWLLCVSLQVHSNWNAQVSYLTLAAGLVLYFFLFFTIHTWTCCVRKEPIQSKWNISQAIPFLLWKLLLSLSFLGVCSFLFLQAIIFI